MGDIVLLLLDFIRSLGAVTLELRGGSSQARGALSTDMKSTPSGRPSVRTDTAHVRQVCAQALRVGAHAHGASARVPDHGSKRMRKFRVHSCSPLSLERTDPSVRAFPRPLLGCSDTVSPDLTKGRGGGWGCVRSPSWD